MGRFKHWSLDRKICVGYGVAFTLAIAGIAAGFLLTQNTERRVLKLQAQAMEDVAAISDLKTGIIELILHAQALQSQNQEDPSPAAIAAGFGHDFSHLLEDYEQFKRDWRMLQVLCEQHQHGSSARLGLEAGQMIKPLLAQHETAIDAYIEQFDHLTQIDVDTIQLEQVAYIQAELQALEGSPFIAGLEDFLDHINALSEATTAEQSQTTALLQQSVTFQRSVMLGSILVSGLFGLIVMRLTSRNLCRPLKDMTQRAQRSILEGDLSLQMPVGGHDEVGVLAAAFNNYSAFIADLVRRDREMNQQLQTTLEELNQTQLQVIQQEKMSSLGQLVAGVAHELNNPTTFIYSNLAYIQAYADQLLELLQLYQDDCAQLNPSAELKCQAVDLEFIRADLPKALASMEAGSERICGIVRSLQNFSRSDALTTDVVDIHTGIDDTAVILGHRLNVQANRPAIQLVTQRAALPLVECYPGLLNQVFLNLLANAIDAIDARSHHPRTYSAKRPPQITLSTELVDSQRIQVTVADNGIGISPQVEGHIFDPFFSTKPVGEGTGMGLSMSYQVIERHGGELTCAATGPQGSTFVVTLPVRLPPRSISSPAVAHRPSITLGVDKRIATVERKGRSPTGGPSPDSYMYL